MEELLRKAQELVEPGNYLIIDFYKGTQLETMEGDDYDDDIWYVAEETSSKEVPMFVSYGYSFEVALKQFIQKKESE